MIGLQMMPTEIQLAGKVVSLHSIYESGGIDLRVEHGTRSIPNKEFVTMADVHSMLTGLEDRVGQNNVGFVDRVFAIEVNEFEDNKEASNPVLGVTIDLGQHNAGTIARSGFAIFAQRNSNDDVPNLFLTEAHELTHIFNIHHNDWEGASFTSGSTIEGWSTAKTVLWRLSAASIRHLREHPSVEVWPSNTALPFRTITSSHCDGHQKANPREPYDVVDSLSFKPLLEHCESDMARLLPSVWIGGGDASRSESGKVSLELESPKPTFVVGEPIVLTLGLHNIGRTREDVNPLLNPEYGFMDIEIQAPGSDSFQPFLPSIVRDVRNVRLASLLPGDALYDEARIFFNGRGWLFGKPGKYLVKGSFSLDLDGKLTIQSKTIEISIVLPQREVDKRASALIDGDEQGIILLLNGGDHLKHGMDNLRRLLAEEPAATQAPAVRLALGLNALKPTVKLPAGIREVRLWEAYDNLSRIFGAALPPISVVSAEQQLALELSKQGEEKRAERIGELIKKYFSSQRSVTDLLISNKELAVGPLMVLPHWSRYKYPTTIAPGVQYYVVRRGDTLSRIAAKVLGHATRWPLIARSNPYVVNPHLIFPGDPLIVDATVLGAKETSS
jgi:hypothetical protein